MKPEQEVLNDHTTRLLALEFMVQALMYSHFKQENDPIRAARYYADGVRAMMESKPDQDHASMAFQEAVNRFLDRLIVQMQTDQSDGTGPKLG